ncbi:hypothetical protein KR018_003763 [Drosophila ironensis]|nr:hypothetical protein KR018_003763 [Drosophila ironensis]
MLQLPDGDENATVGGQYLHDYDYDFEAELGQDHFLPLKLNESWAARRLMEALSHLPPNSQSAPMRFQQRTQQEQEVRRRELLASKPGGDGFATTALAAPTPASGRVIGNGKVRQMFDERRRGAGIDRSNPLKPIGTLPSPPAAAKSHHTSQVSVQRLAKGLSTMSLKEPSTTTRHNFASDSNNNKFAPPRNPNSTRNLKPVVTRKTPPPAEGRGAGRSVSSPTRSVRPPPVAAAPRQPTGTLGSTRSPPQNRRVSSVIYQSSPDISAAAPPEGTALCRFCGRHFNTERLSKHEGVCQKTISTKRKIFDASKQRAVGTESEKLNKRMKGARSQSSYSSAAQQKGLSTGVKKNNWRKTHEEFIQSIRAAKQVQAHLARGGKLSDLPPPPPSENPDYIQCPHCGRRFNQQAAERHIPKCETMIHNKPRQNGPPPLKKR